MKIQEKTRVINLKSSCSSLRFKCSINCYIYCRPSAVEKKKKTDVTKKRYDLRSQKNENESQKQAAKVGSPIRRGSKNLFKCCSQKEKRNVSETSKNQGLGSTEGYNLRSKKKKVSATSKDQNLETNKKHSFNSPMRGKKVANDKAKSFEFRPRLHKRPTSTAYPHPLQKPHLSGDKPTSNCAEESQSKARKRLPKYTTDNDPLFDEFFQGTSSPEERQKLLEKEHQRMLEATRQRLRYEQRFNELRARSHSSRFDEIAAGNKSVTFVPLFMSQRIFPNPFTGRSSYDVLGVPYSASDEEVKKQFRNLCLLCHPDKNKHKEASDLFCKFRKAYENIKSDRKRSFSS